MTTQTALRDQLIPVIQEAARTYGVPEGLLIQMMAWESANFSPDVVYGRRKGADGEIGVAQFMPATRNLVAAKIGNFDPANPYEAIPAAAWLLKNEADTFGGDWEKGVAAYNAGAPRVAQAIKDASVGRLYDTSDRGDWKKFLPASTRDIYLPNVYGAGENSPSPTTFSSMVTPPGTGSAGVSPTRPGDIAPPDLNKFIAEYGDVEGYRLYLESYKTYQSMRYQEAADVSTYLDALTNEISQEIAVGNLSLAQANAAYGRRMDALTQGNSMYKDLLQYAIPPSSVGGYLPGGEPGGLYESLGLAPRSIPASDVSQINPFQMAQQVLAESPPIPTGVPDISALQGGSAQLQAALEAARGGSPSSTTNAGRGTSVGSLTNPPGRAPGHRGF